MQLPLLLRAFAPNRYGQSLTEYALILVLVALTSYVALDTLGQKITDKIDDTTGALSETSSSVGARNSSGPETSQN